MLIGVDVGGTNLRIGVIDGLKIIDEQRANADFSGLCKSNAPDSALQAIHLVLTDALNSTLLKFPAVQAIGLGFPGFIVSGRVAQSPNLPGLLDVDLVTPLQHALQRPVIIENDALAAAYGEYCLNSLGSGGLVYLGLGTGVGGGLITGGDPYPGEHGVAMEVGHIITAPGGRLCGCGNRGCMEQYASASGVVQTYFETTQQRLSAHQIAQRAEAGEGAAIDAYDVAGMALAQALAHILKVADVGHVVIGGGMSAAWRLLEPAFTAQLEQDLIPALRGKVVVSISQAGDQAGMIGAALLASRK